MQLLKIKKQRGYIINSQDKLRRWIYYYIYLVVSDGSVHDATGEHITCLCPIEILPIPPNSRLHRNLVNFFFGKFVSFNIFRIFTLL